MLGWDPERVVVENKLVGGGFGGKEDVSAQHIAALAALKVYRPVKVTFSRQESINFHPKRHAMEGTFTLGCDENGIFTGLDCEIYFDTGAYASLCGPVLERACTHSVDRIAIRIQTSGDMGIIRIILRPEHSGDSAYARVNFALESNINLLRRRWASLPGRSATAMPSSRARSCRTDRSPTVRLH